MVEQIINVSQQLSIRLADRLELNDMLTNPIFFVFLFTMGI